MNAQVRPTAAHRWLAEHATAHSRSATAAMDPRQVGSSTWIKRVCSTASLIFLASVSFASEAKSQTAPGSGQTGSTAEPARDQNAAIAEFLKLYRLLRAGEPYSEPQLQALLLELQEWRPEIIIQCDYFRSLTPEERREGFAAEQEYNALWGPSGDLVAGMKDVRLWLLENGSYLNALEDLATRPLSDRTGCLQAASLLSYFKAKQSGREQALGDQSWRETAAQAKALAEQANDGFVRMGMQTRRCESLWVLGFLAFQEAQYSRASEHLQNSLELSRERKQLTYEKQSLRTLVRVAEAIGDVAWVDELLDQLTRVDSPYDSWFLSRQSAKRLLAQDHPEAALQALSMYPPEPDKLAEVAICDLLSGLCEARLGNLDRAEEHFHKSRYTLPDWSRLGLVRLEIARGNPARAMELAQKSGSRKFDNPVLFAEIQAVIGEAALAMGNHELALDHLRRAIEAGNELDQNNLEDIHNLERARGIIGEVLGLHSVACYAKALLETDRALEAMVVMEDFQARSLREQELTFNRLLKLAGQNDSAPKIEVDNLKEWAHSSDLGLVSFVIGPDFGVSAYLNENGQAFGKQINAGRADLGTAFKRLNHAILEDNPGRASRLGREIAKELLPKPLIERLRKSGQANDHPRLIICLHGPTAQLSFERLELEDGTLLDDCAELLFLPGLPSLRPEPSPSASRNSQRWGVFGQPVANLAFAELPAASGELLELRERYPNSRSVMGQDFRRDLVLSELKKCTHAHFATHLGKDRCHSGLFGPQGLVLSHEERLCSEDLAAQAFDLELAVLAACHSSSGHWVDADGVRGVARALLENGTRNVLVTQWSIGDAAAAEFSLLFHEELAKSGSPGRAASRARAQLRMRAAPARNWAAFRLLGQD